MIYFIKGNLLESNAEALVNTVNIVGVMGKGIALQFQKAFPANAKAYMDACKSKSLSIGKLLITKEDSLLEGEKTIINFPTKTQWQLPSEYEYINAGLESLRNEIENRQIQSVAIPPLGAGNGGLDWQRVKQLIVTHLGDLDADIYIYEPNAAIQEVLKKERVKLTPARAMLLGVFYELVRDGEFVSEFAAEKIAYFLQRFGGKASFKLTYSANFYGPYSGKVRHMLYYLNGSYIMGYSSKDKKPFEELELVMDAETDIDSYLNQPENRQYKAIVERTKGFLSGFYSPFGLELLSTIDFIISDKKVNSIEEISAELNSWSDRKKTLFSNPRFIEVALGNIHKHLPQ